MPHHSILVIDDDPAMTALAEHHLTAAGYTVSLAETGAEALELAATRRFGVVLTDMMLPDMDGIEIVRHFKVHAPDTELIMITGYSTVETAIEAIKAGAFHFVEKPVKFEEVLLLIERALERRQQTSEIVRLRNEFRLREKYFDIIGASKAMQTIYEMIENVAESDANVLIIGESGTGKELVANAIHYRSLRASGPFVKVNCSALPRELIESELFGHTRGAFTGATQDKTGVIGQANGGSLLMDEIGEMPLELQPKLLRVLQERVYYRVGGEKPLDVNFRLISATNRNPHEAIANGHLREDLFYRINTIEIHVPPLRERSGGT
jgi:DNA-binding NtrC family response regulator